MKIEARHVKRKQLVQYLDVEFLKQERKSFQQYTASAIGSAVTSTKRLSNSLGTGHSKRQRVSESVSEAETENSISFLLCLV